MSCHRRRRDWTSRLAAAFVGVALLAAGLPTTAEAVVPPISGRGSKVVTADELPTVQINGVVTTQVIVGNTVYAGGEFSNARPAGAAPGSNQQTRNHLLSYNIETGQLTSFAPAFNGRVRALALSVDKTILYVGGTFTSIGGATRNNFAAFRVSDGALLGLAPSVNGTVTAIAATGSAIYFGGSFSSVNGVTRTRLAAVNTSGALTAWAPAPTDTVYAMVAAPGLAKIIVAGGFKAISGKNAYGMASLDAQTAARTTWNANLTIKNYGEGAAIWSLAVDGDTVYGTGYSYRSPIGNNLEGAFAARASDGTISWIQDCHGDTYSVAPVGDVVYSVGHAHFCGNIGGFPESSPRGYQHALAVTKTARGTVAPNTTNPGRLHANYGGQPAPSLYHWFPELTPGTYTGLTQAAWSVVGNSQYLALGGEFTEVNGEPQQGLVRLAVPSLVTEREGPVDTRVGTAPVITAGAQGSATVRWIANWDPDERTLSYDVLRNGQVVATASATSNFWTRPTVQASDTGLNSGATYDYQIRARDPFGNSVTSPATSFRYPPVGTYAETVTDADAVHFWRFNDPAGSTSSNDLAGSADLNLSSDVRLGGRSPQPADPTTVAIIYGNTSGSSTAGPESATDELSIEFWVKTARAQGSLVAFGSAAGGASVLRTRELYVNGNGQLMFATAGTSGPLYLETDESVADNRWHHVVAVQSGSRSVLYVDGLERAASTETPDVTGTGRWWLGGAPANPLLRRVAGLPFIGTIDDVAVYSQALSGAEVHDHYQVGMQ